MRLHTHLYCPADYLMMDDLKQGALKKLRTLLKVLRTYSQRANVHRFVLQRERKSDYYGYRTRQ